VIRAASDISDALGFAATKRSIHAA
jgi:hypothetical protein